MNRYPTGDLMTCCQRVHDTYARVGWGNDGDIKPFAHKLIRDLKTDIQTGHGGYVVDVGTAVEVFDAMFYSKLSEQALAELRTIMAG